MNCTVNLFAGWAGFLAGAASGALIGLYFHRDDWLGDYDSFRRRMTRLGHIACWGIGLLNILYALTADRMVPSCVVNWGALSLLVAMVTMPGVCFLTAWKKPFRHLFFLPVSAVSAGVIAVLFSLR